MAGADTQSLWYPCKATAGEGEQPEDENPEDETPEDDCEDLSYEALGITYTCSDAKETFGFNALVAEHCPTTCETEGCGGSTNVDQKPEGEEDDKANDCSKADAYGPTCDSHSGCSDWQPLPTDFICVDNGNGECMAGADTQSLWYPCKASAEEEPPAGECPETCKDMDFIPISGIPTCADAADRCGEAIANRFCPCTCDVCEGKSDESGIPGMECDDLEGEFDLQGNEVSCAAAQSQCDNLVVAMACPRTCGKCDDDITIECPDDEPNCKEDDDITIECPEDEPDCKEDDSPDSSEEEPDCSEADTYGPSCDSHSGCSEWQPLPSEFICVDNGNGECMAGADTQSLWYPCKATAEEEPPAGECPETCK